MNFFQSASGVSSDADSLLQNFNNLLNGKSFIEIVRVEAIDSQTVDLMPLVTQRDLSGAPIDNSVVYGAQVWRLQRGSSAVIMDPVVGDIGIALYCDRDSDNARSDRTVGAPTSNRNHSKTDGIYLGGILNQEPNQYIEFADGQINVVSPSLVNVTSPSVKVTASSGVTIDTPDAHFTGNVTAAGNITDNSGSQSSSLKSLRDAYNSHTHAVSGVQSGSSTVTSNTPGSPV